MIEQYPVTPPPELVAQIRSDALRGSSDVLDYELRMIHAAYRAGADQELEACCELVTNATVIPPDSGQWLYSRRRPKPPSLKEQALQALLHIDQGQHNEHCHIIRRALEQLDD